MSADPLAEAREALESGAVEPERIVEGYAPALEEEGRLYKLLTILPHRHRSLVHEWSRQNGSNGAVTPTPAGVRRLSDVEAEEVDWLWKDRIPLGKLAGFDGDPGLMKSTATLDIAARLSTGRPMPDGTEPDLDGPCGTVLLTAEDGLADTVRPRLDAAGGDPGRVAVIEEVPDPEGGMRLPDLFDLEVIEAAVKAVGARLVVIDPLMAYLPPDVNSHRDQDVRRALAPLARLADELGVAVVFVRHLNKSGGNNPKYRGGGSIGILGAARAGHIFGEDPDAPDTRRIFAPVKSNLSEPAPPLAYRAVQAENGAVRVEWEGEADHGADTLLDRRSPEERTKVQEAAHVLEEELSDGPRPVPELHDVADQLGISERTMSRAARRLDVVRQPGGFGEPWEWRLPDEGGDPPRERVRGETDDSGGRQPPTAQGSSGDSTPSLANEARDTGGECRDCGRSIGPAATICGRCRREES